MSSATVHRYWDVVVKQCNLLTEEVGFHGELGFLFRGVKTDADVKGDSGEEINIIAAAHCVMIGLLVVPRRHVSHHRFRAVVKNNVHYKGVIKWLDAA